MKPTLSLLTFSGVIGAGAAVAAAPAVAADLNVTVEIPRLSVAEYHKPYVAIWIENPADASAAGTLAVWYDADNREDHGAKWLKDMRQWWRKAGREMSFPADGVSGATRAPGEAVLQLDKHPALAQLPAGNYELVVEAAREAGGREVLRLPLAWPVKAAQQAKAQGEHELGAVQLNTKP